MKVRTKTYNVEFPILAEDLVDAETFAVLFLSEEKDVVVKGNKHNAVGDLDSNYVSVTNESVWHILSSAESIVLSND